MEEEIMEIMTVGGQSSSGERKEYFFALALDRSMNPKTTLQFLFFSVFFQLSLVISSLAEYHAWVMQRRKGISCRSDSLISFKLNSHLFSKLKCGNYEVAKICFSLKGGILDSQSVDA